MTEAVELGPEDAKLVALARGARGRTDALEGAAVRDETGRSYAASNVDLPSITLTALQLAVAMAVAAGANGCEAAAVVSVNGFVNPAGLAALGELGGEEVPVFACTPDGALVATRTAGYLG